MTNLTGLENHSDARPTVIALHCSGGSGHQWKSLSETLGNEFSVVAPDLIGCGSAGPWNGKGKFSLSVEAAPVVETIDATREPVHLVGHSYGGCVALRAACERPERIASLTLYEPVSFHMLASAGPNGEIALNEITSVFDDVLGFVKTGAIARAAERFADYWNGTGTFAAASEKIRAALIRYINKAPLDYQAVMSERLPASMSEVHVSDPADARRAHAQPDAVDRRTAWSGYAVRRLNASRVPVTWGRLRTPTP